jgi:hypothetical protein
VRIKGSPLEIPLQERSGGLNCSSDLTRFVPAAEPDWNSPGALASAVLGRQLLITLSRASEVSNFERMATKERMILHVRPPERLPPTADTPRRPVKRA